MSEGEAWGVTMQDLPSATPAWPLGGGWALEAMAALSWRFQKYGRNSQIFKNILISKCGYF